MNRRVFLAGGPAAGLGLAFSAAADTAAPALEDRRAAWLDLLGPFPQTIPRLETRIESRGELEPGIAHFHVSYQSEADDRVTAWLLVPDAALPGPAPLVLCPHSTTQGAGKDRIAGLAGAAPGTPPDAPAESRAYGRELARWGYVTLCMDLYGDGRAYPAGPALLPHRRLLRKTPRVVGHGQDGMGHHAQR